MPTLSSFIVQREIAPMRTMEEAIARQVLHGGDLATNLLEVSTIPEAALGRAIAESYGLEAAPPGRLGPPPASALRALPAELALRHGIFPLARDADLLLVATSEPLPSSVEDDFSFALGVTLRQAIAPLVRIRQAIAEYYGLPLDRRFLRLVARLEGRADPSPSSLPPRVMSLPVALPRPASVPPATFGTGGVSAPPRAGIAGPTPPVTAPDQPVAMPEVPRDAPSPSDPEHPGDAAMEPAPAQPPPRGRIPGGEQALAGLMQRAAEQQRRAGSDSSPPHAARPGQASGPRARTRRKGPLTAAMGEEELELATTTEALLEIYFAFTHQFLQYAVLFVVHGDLAEGRDAAGPGADRARVVGIGVPLDLPSILSRARDTKAPVLAPLSLSGLDAELARDLGRVKVGARGGQVIVMPITVRGRVVALLYGDDGDEDVELGALGEVIAFTGLATRALEQLILRKKMGDRAPSKGVPLGRIAREVGDRRKRQGEGREGAAVLADVVKQQSAIAADAGRDVITSKEGLRGRGAAVERTPLITQVSPSAESIRPTELGDRGGPGGAGDPVPPVSAEPADDEMSLAIDAMLTPEPTAAPAPVLASVPDDAPEIAIEEQAAELEDTAADDDSEQGLEHAIHRVVEAPPPLPGRGSESPRLPAIDVPMVAGSLAVAPTQTPPYASPVTPEMARAAHAMAQERKMTLRGVVPATSSPEAGAEPPAQEPAPGSQRRGAAPSYGRARAHTPRPGDVLPAMPPPNATSMPSPLPPRTASPSAPPPSARTAEGFEYPLTPPPPTAAAVHRMTRRPIRREEEDRGGFEDASDLILQAERSPPAARSEPPKVDRSRTSSSWPPGLRPSLPSVIVDVDAEYASLLERVLSGGPDSDDAFAELVRNGDQVLPGLVSRFPGPLRVDRHRARDHLPAASQCGPILELMVAMRRLALPFITVRTTSTDPDARFWATHVLAELRYPEAANAILPRLFDDEVAVRRIARRAAASLVSAGEAGEPVLVGLDHLVRNVDEAIPRRVLAIETMGEIRAGALVPPLMAVLTDPSEEVQNAARRALLLITRQDFARDVGRWGQWWTKNLTRHRVEWLIDALMHEVPSLRRAAGDELKQITKEYFGYYDDLPKKERERAQGRYRDWWAREGKQRFGP